MDKKQKKMMIGAIAVVAIIVVAAVAVLWMGGDGEDESEPIQFGYVLWEGEIAATNVMTLVLEEAGFEVDMVNVDAGIMYESLASGDLDISVSAWLPATQANYWEVYGDNIDDVGVNLEGCAIGLVVPQYLEDVNSIYDLANYSSEFQDRIVGIDPGAGMMTNTADAITEYGLDGYELLASSSAGMLAELTAAYADEEHIVVTLWSPHWAFAEWDLKYLADPLGVFGEEEFVHSLAREGFQQDNPEAYGILERFNWTQDDIQSIMADIASGTDEEEAAQKWIDANRDQVDAWLGEQGDVQYDTIRFGYVLWEGEIAATNVMTLVLQEAGFDVEMINTDAGIMYQSLASGDLDISVSAWLPATQANYWDVYGDNIDDVGINLEGCAIGLVVPTYLTDVNSIYDLANYSSEFQDRIVGIDPGAGMMTNTQDAIDQYDLGFDLLASSSAGMLAELTAAYEDDEFIVVTLWSPHWAFAEWDLKYLADPLGVFGEEEFVHSLAREGFQQDNPEAYAILERFNWTQDDIQSIMADIAGGMDEVDAAQKWIDANRDKVDQWLGL